MTYDAPTGTNDFLAKLRKEQFTAFIDDADRPIIRDQLERRRQPSKGLLDYARANRNAIAAALQCVPYWVDENGEDRCRECSAFVFPDLIDGIVVTCGQRALCPFWREPTADEIFELPDPAPERPRVIYRNREAAT